MCYLPYCLGGVLRHHHSRHWVKCMLTLEPVRVVETLSEVYKAPALPLCYTGVTRLSLYFAMYIIINVSYNNCCKSLLAGEGGVGPPHCGSKPHVQCTVRLLAYNPRYARKSSIPFGYTPSWVMFTKYVSSPCSVAKYTTPK